MKLKKSTIVLIVLAVIFLGLSVVSTKYSVTRTIHAIDEIGDMKLNDDSIDRFKKAAEYYQALDQNQNLEEKITNLKTYKEARLNYARLMIKQASLADKKQDGAADAVKEAREAVDTYVPADEKWNIENYQDLLDCGSYAGAREKGLVRMEGKEYVVQDGDVILFRFNV